MAGQGPITVDRPGAPAGPTGTVWPLKEQPWNDKPNPWIQSPESPNEGGRISPPPGGNNGPVTNTNVPLG